MAKYPLERKNPEPDLIIEQLREKIREEKRNASEKKCMLCKPRRRGTIIIKRKINTQDPNFIPSYDNFGRLMEVQQFEAFPNITPHCVEKEVAIKSPSTNPAKFKFTGKEVEQEKTIVENQDLKLNDVSLPLFFPLGNVYDNLSPSSGVTFHEEGKAPEINPVNHQQNKNRLSKEAYYTLRSDISLSKLIKIKREQIKDEEVTLLNSKKLNYNF